MEKLKQEKILIESKLHELQVKSYNWLDEDKVKKHILNLKQNLFSSDNKLRRKVIETFVEKIKIYPDRIDLNYKICMTTNSKVERGFNGGGEVPPAPTTVSILN